MYFCPWSVVLFLPLICLLLLSWPALAEPVNSTATIQKRWLVRLDETHRFQLKLANFSYGSPCPQRVWLFLSDETIVRFDGKLERQQQQQQQREVTSWNCSKEDGFNLEVTLTGLRLGKSDLSIVLEEPSYHRVYKVLVGVQRPERLIDRIFNVTLPVLVFLACVVYGCKIDLLVVVGILKRPLAPLIGLFCQAIILPLIGYAVVRATQLGKDLALGLLALTCSPSGSASNVWSVLLDGDLDLSITMTFLSCLISLATMPMWLLLWFGPEFTEHDVNIPFAQPFYTLITLTVGIGFGLLIRRFFKKFAEKLVKYIRPISVFLLIAIIVFAIVANLYMFELMSRDWRVLFCGFVLPIGAMGVGLLAALITRLEWSRAVTVAIETSVQNTGVAIVILRWSLPEPEGDIASVMPVSFAIFTPVPLLITLVIYRLYRLKHPRPETADRLDDHQSGGAGSKQGSKKGLSKRQSFDEENDGGYGGGDDDDDDGGGGGGEKVAVATKENGLV